MSLKRRVAVKAIKKAGAKVRGSGGGLAGSQSGTGLRAPVVAAGLSRVVLKAAGRAGLVGAAIDGAVGTYQAVKAVRKGKSHEDALLHVAHKAAGGFVAGAMGTVCAATAVTVVGPGIFALAAGMLGASGAVKIFNKLLGPSPIA